MVHEIRIDAQDERHCHIASPQAYVVDSDMSVLSTHMPIEKPPPCNFFYLARCNNGDHCKYEHNYPLTPEQVGELRVNAKKWPCPAINNGMCLGPCTPCMSGDGVHIWRRKQMPAWRELHHEPLLSKGSEVCIPQAGQVQVCWEYVP